MSAICGAISLCGNNIPKEHVEILKKAFSGCVIDRWEELESTDVYMRCGVQYFTKEARGEKLPIRRDDFFFNADVVLDNRRELYSVLSQDNMCSEDFGEMPDSELLCKGIEKYGFRGLRNILGVYTFAYYKKSEKKVILASDAIGGRYVYYMEQDGILYYASLMEPLIQIQGKPELNRRWLADFIAQDNLNIYTESEENPIAGIYRTAPGHYVEITAERRSVVQYWDPTKKIRSYRRKNDEEYKEEFLSLFFTCVKDTLRSDEETGIFLSGGYDSTAVAVVASEFLKKRHQTLYSFTSVPFKGYESEFGPSCVTDETEAVQKTAEILGNVECTFMDSPSMNGWFDRKEYVKIAEIPYKSPQNMLWMYEGYKQAQNRNVRILLGGMFGNGTISYDNTQLYMIWLLRHLRFRRLLQEATAFRDKRNYTRKSILLTTVKQALGLQREPQMTIEDFEKSFAKMEVLKENGALQRLLKRENRMRRDMRNARKSHLAFIPMDTIRHYGEFAQKNSLYTGVLLRDPTRDPRMIELTMNLPEDQFTHNGYTRRLITDYMGDLVPKHVIEERRLGRQSADLKARILQRKEEILEEWKENYRKYSKTEWIDCKKALDDLESTNLEDMTDFQIVRHIYTNIFLEYVATYS